MSKPFNVWTEARTEVSKTKRFNSNVLVNKNGKQKKRNISKGHRFNLSLMKYLGDTVSLFSQVSHTIFT